MQRGLGRGRMAAPAKYSFWSLLRNAGSYHQGWQRVWRQPEPKSAYEVVIIGGGGHGLATAYYLATVHGITDVAVIEKGWLGGGNTGRNTTVVRSNYLYDESSGIYELSMKLWEGLSQELNYNTMFSQRGVLGLSHDRHGNDEQWRRGGAIRLNGIDSELLSVAQVKAFVPIINTSTNIRYPLLGGMLQRRGGNARHDAVAWGFARGADAHGIDILQETEVTGLVRKGGGISAIETTRGTIHAKRVGIAVAGHSGVLAGMAGFRLPIESFPLQALVSEPIKPVLNTVIMSGKVHVYLSQSDKGELVIGASRDAHNSYSQRGSFHLIEEQIAALVELFPLFGRLRMMRQWGGIVDVCPDASPIVGNTPVDGLYINCGWGTGGFKATPGSGWVFAHTLATGEPHPINAPFSLNRFSSGYLIDEHGAAGVAH